MGILIIGGLIEQQGAVSDSYRPPNIAVTAVLRPLLLLIRVDGLTQAATRRSCPSWPAASSAAAHGLCRAWRPFLLVDIHGPPSPVKADQVS
jgi:hypothetical protein